MNLDREMQQRLAELQKTSDTLNYGDDLVKVIEVLTKLRAAANDPKLPHSFMPLMVDAFWVLSNKALKVV